MISQQEAFSHIEKLEKDAYKALESLAENYGSYPWVISFSGGKDSTLLLHLITNYIVGYRKSTDVPQKLYIVYNDTLGELDCIRAWAKRVLDDVVCYLKDRGFVNIEKIITKPKVTETFYWRVILRGYPPPTFKFRWCTELLKISPTRRIMKELVEKHGKIIWFIGVREDESKARSRSLKQRQLASPFDGLAYLLLKSDNSNIEKVALIRFWREEDVFAYLRTRTPAWAWKSGNFDRDYYSELLKLYLGSGSHQYSPRYGCWFCTVVTNHLGLKLLIEELHMINLRILEKARTLLRKLGNYRCLRLYKESGYSRLGPLNLCGRALALKIIEFVDRKIKLYGLNEKVYEGITLRELLFELNSTEALQIVLEIDGCDRVRSLDFDKLRDPSSACRSSDERQIMKEIMEELEE